jgi:hypothetical protein
VHVSSVQIQIAVEVCLVLVMIFTISIQDSCLMTCPESNGADSSRDYEKINLRFSADWNLGLFGV